MRTLAIGDIHGCDTALSRLLREVRPEATDRLVFLGDYIDRGPGSRAVIERMLCLPGECSTVFLRGNHEVMMLEARNDPLKAKLWQRYGGLETLASYGAESRDDWWSAVPEAHWTFLKRTRPCFETSRAIFAHACVDPELNLEKQPDQMLYWEFFDQIQPHKSGKRIVLGHTPQRSGRIKDLGFAICLDTAAVSGGWLTCLDTDSGQYWQARENGDARTGRLADDALET